MLYSEQEKMDEQANSVQNSLEKRSHFKRSKKRIGKIYEQQIRKPSEGTVAKEDKPTKKRTGAAVVQQEITKKRSTTTVIANEESVKQTGEKEITSNEPAMEETETECQPTTKEILDYFRQFLQPPLSPIR